MGALLRVLRLNHVPPLQPRLRAWALGAMLLTGGLIGLGGIGITLLRPPVTHSAFLVVTLAALTLGGWTLRWGQRLPSWAFHAAVVAGNLVVAGTVILMDDGTRSVAAAMLFLWGAVYAATFFSTRAALAHNATAIACCAVAFTLIEVPLGVELLWLASTSTVLTVTLSWLAAHAAVAESDPLTGALNRRGFDARAESAIADAARTGAPLALALVDVDGFQELNQQRGYGAGDRLLRELVGRWRPLLRTTDALGRFGGDEFVVLLPRCSTRDTVALIDRLRAATPEPHTFSVGVAAWQPGDSPSMLLAQADIALYEAKCGGRNRTVVRGDELDAAHALLRAVSAGEMVLHYQPCIEPRTGRVQAVEALVRWEDPTRGLVPPGEFIPTAERNGAIVALGAWVLHEACRQLSRWRRLDHLRDLVMAVNLSPPQLTQPYLLATVGAALDAAGLPPTALRLELTETAMADIPPAAVDVLHALSELGCELAIDDFGIGQSSLGRLRRLPVDVLKLDRSFITDLEAEDTATMVGAMLDMGRGLGLRIIAEGVETPAQLAFLRDRGCDEVQGFLLAGPAPAERVEADLGAQARGRWLVTAGG